MGAPLISMDKNGGRTVHLFIPFEHNGKTIETITFKAFRFGDTLRWTGGEWKDSLALMTEMDGVDEAVIRELRYPDAMRVQEAFFALLPPEVSGDVASGIVPTRVAADEQPRDVLPAHIPTNGGGQEFGPGVPLPDMPESGFDMNEEP